MTEPTFSTTNFDPEQPAAFYMLGGSLADLEALADATLVVGGKRLPVHSQVLSLQSGVLRGLFVDLSRGGSGDKEEMVIEAPFQDAALLDACLFLRFCYRHEDRTPANLETAPECLPGLLRLAHKLDAPLIEKAACDCLAGRVRWATQSELLDWMAAADHCQQDELRLSCIGQIGRRLARDPGSLAAAFADAAALAERCDKGVLAQLVGLLATAGGKHVGGGMPAVCRAAAALEQSANHASFEWALERYSQQPSDVGQATYSPWFTAAGKQWRFQVNPGGNSEAAAGHLSVYLNCKQPKTRAKWSMTLIDQTAESPQHITAGPSKDADVFDPGWGTPKILSHQALRARPGYLAGDRLLLRARVEVVP